MAEYGCACFVKHRVSVSNLVSFACRTGDLVLQGQHGPTAQQGIEAHKKIQQQARAGSEAEVRVKTEVDIAADTIVLTGRMDMLFALESPVRIQEIKTTLVAPEHVPTSAR